MIRPLDVIDDLLEVGLASVDSRHHLIHLHRPPEVLGTYAKVLVTLIITPVSLVLKQTLIDTVYERLGYVLLNSNLGKLCPEGFVLDGLRPDTCSIPHHPRPNQQRAGITPLPVLIAHMFRSEFGVISLRNLILI